MNFNFDKIENPQTSVVRTEWTKLSYKNDTIRLLEDPRMISTLQLLNMDIVDFEAKAILMTAYDNQDIIVKWHFDKDDVEAKELDELNWNNIHRVEIA